MTNGVAAGSFSRFAEAKADADSYRDAEASKRVALGVSLDSAAPATRSLSIQPPSRAAGETKLTDSRASAENARSRDDAAATANRFNESRQVAAPPPSPAAAPTGGSRLQDKSFVARGGGVEKDAERVYSQSFANVAPELRAKAAKVKSETTAVPVLAKFQVQQVGDQLRVIDGDGSTYVGEMNKNFAADNGAGTGGKETAALAFETAKKPVTQGFAGGVMTNQQATQDYYWRVEGTNRTLNQNVVFTWNFVATSNNPATTQLNTAGPAAGLPCRSGIRAGLSPRPGSTTGPSRRSRGRPSRA